MLVPPNDSKRARALSIWLSSVSLLASLVCLMSWAGLMTRRTTVARMARMPMTMRSSMRVKPADKHALSFQCRALGRSASGGKIACRQAGKESRFSVFDFWIPAR